MNKPQVQWHLQKINKIKVQKLLNFIVIVNIFYKIS